jgi:hypothetical protein
MNKIKAIKQAREFILENREFNEKLNLWETYTRPAGADIRHDLKNRRIIYTLQLMGVNEEAARTYAYQCYNIPFRDAIYKFGK